MIKKILVGLLLVTGALKAQTPTLSCTVNKLPKDSVSKVVNINCTGTITASIVIPESSKVITTVPVPVPVITPTNPADTTFKIFAQSNFESGNLSPFVNSKSNSPVSDSLISIVDDPSNSGHGKVAKLHYAGNANDSNLSISEGLAYDPKTFLGTGIGLGQSLIIEGDYYIPSVLPGSENAIRKLIYLQPDRCCWAAAKVFYTIVWQEGTGINLGYGFSSPNFADSQSDVTVRLGNMAPFGQWHHVKLEQTTNTAPNKKDGIVKLTFDNKLVYQNNQATWTDPSWTDSNNSVYFGVLLVGDQVNWGVGPFDEFRYWDNVIMSRK